MNQLYKFYKETYFLKNKDYVFAHAAKYQLPDKKILIGCYHPSPRNVNTKRINLSKMVRLFKNAKKISSEQLCLPLYPGLKKSEISYVVNSLKKIIKRLT